MHRHDLLLRPALAAALLGAVILGGLAYGVLTTVCRDTGPDW